MRAPAPRAVVAALICLLLGGCAGYRLGAIQPTFMKGVRTVAIPTTRNATLIPDIEVLVADTIIRQVQEDGTYKVVSNLDDADAVLETEITQIVRRPSRSVLGDIQATEEFEMTLVIHYRVINRATGGVVDDRTTTGTTTFFVSGDVNQDERQAIPLAAQNAATHIVSEISEGW